MFKKKTQKTQKQKEFIGHGDRIMQSMTGGWLWRNGRVGSEAVERLHMFVNEPGPMPTERDVYDLKLAIERELSVAWGKTGVVATLKNGELTIFAACLHSNGEFLDFKCTHQLNKRTPSTNADVA